MKLWGEVCGELWRRWTTALLLVLFLAAQGCGVVRTGSPLIGLSPAAEAVVIGSKVSFLPTGLLAGSTCSWSSSDPQVLVSDGSGSFRGRAAGSASALAQCGENTAASAAVIVNAITPGPIVITRGGTYSGVWTSDDPKVPAVSIHTDEPVVLRNSVITSRGDLIDITGTGKGANVAIRNVSGTALDPEIAGMQRGAFISATGVNTLRVKHCSMFGVSFGIEVSSSILSALTITQNLASNLEDRASDGNGGLTNARPSLGHFLFLYEDSAPAGAEISWNQVVNRIGSSSTEDVINVFKSQGADGAPIRVHDNYMEGYSSTTPPGYTGTGLITDGDGSTPVTAFVSFESNQMVHTAGSGVEIAVGHDITARGNRVVSCGTDAQGHWFAMPFVNAVVLWNYYNAPEFYNNTVEGTRGGMVRPTAADQPMIADLWARTSDLNGTDSFSPNGFTDPCFVNGEIDLQAEDAERALWVAKLSTAGIVPGDQHMPR